MAHIAALSVHGMYIYGGILILIHPLVSNIDLCPSIMSLDIFRTSPEPESLTAHIRVLSDDRCLTRRDIDI